jgi:CRP-like cAMP-binding protein
VYVSLKDQEPTLTYAPAGAFIGTHMLSDDGQRATLGCQAVTPTSVLVLRPDMIARLVRSHRRFARRLAEHAQDLLDEVIWLFAARSAPLRQRLAAELLRMQDVQPDEDLLSVTEQSLADGIGSIRESVGRSIAEFRRDGSVATTRFGVVVVDRPALELTARAGAFHS